MVVWGGGYMMYRYMEEDGGVEDGSKGLKGVGGGFGGEGRALFRWMVVVGRRLVFLIH